MRKVRIYVTLVLVLVAAAIIGVIAWSQAAAGSKAGIGAIPTRDLLLYIIFGTLLLFIVFMVINIYFRVNRLVKTEFVHEPSLTFGKWLASLNQRIFTKAVPVEREGDILLDHDYDGIKELDNSLPPWWKWGFYFTIGVAVIYLLRFHVFHTGPNPEQEYTAEMKMAADKMEALRKTSGEMVDETTVTMADAAGIAEGKQIFQKTCFVCHGSNGEGGVGPNLTDDYWLHGGRINDVFKTIKYGVTDKGMQAWEKQFSPTEIKNLASFIKSIHGTKPANAKAPQGDLFKETAATDSTKAAGKGTTTSTK